MTNFRTRITEIENLGLPIDEIRREADVHRATWNRWKAGTSWPQMRKWAQVEDAVETVKARAAEAAPERQAA